MRLLDVAGTIADLLEPEGQGVTRVVLDVEPLAWDADHLYVYPVEADERGFETGPSVQQNFTMMAVYVTGTEGENARGERDPEVAAFLDFKRHAYTEAVRQTQQWPDRWQYLTAAMADAPRTLEKRGMAVRLSGYRLIVD